MLETSQIAGDRVRPRGEAAGLQAAQAGARGVFEDCLNEGEAFL